MTDETPDAAAEKSSLRCKVGMHDFHKAITDEGVAYLLCSRCGKEDFPDGLVGGIAPY